MKKLFITIVAVVCYAMTACDNSGMDCEPFTYDDHSLAGSISYTSIYGARVEALYDGEPLGTEYEYGMRASIYTLKDSDTSVDMLIKARYASTQAPGGDIIVVDIPSIPLEGSAFDVTFDYSTTVGSIAYFDRDYSGGLPITVKGWIREDHFSAMTRCSPIEPEYKCDIEITSTTEDGKEFYLHVVNDW